MGCLQTRSSPLFSSMSPLHLPDCTPNTNCSRPNPPNFSQLWTFWFGGYGLQWIKMWVLNGWKRKIALFLHVAVPRRGACRSFLYYVVFLVMLSPRLSYCMCI